jgi:hypothetical protein
MTTPSAIIADLTARGVEFHVQGDKLRFRPVEKVSASEVELIRRLKPEIIALLHDPITRTAGSAWPIIEGTDHFNLYVDSADGDWPEFVPGYHYDIRQPSRLRPLCSAR